MSKRYTVDETWELCLKMWKWISRQCHNKSYAWIYRNLDNLKDQWVVNNKIKGKLESQCFFCEYASKRDGCCHLCPAKKVDEDFGCTHSDYAFHCKPRQFYAELKRLNKIRITKQGASK